jgi:MFS family permease
LKAVWFVYCSVSVTLPYFFSYLVVASNLSVSHATYIAQSLSIVSSVVAVAIGWLVAIFKRGKWIFVSTAAIFLLGMGLLYGFHDPMTQRGTLVGAVVLAGIGLGGNSGNAFALVQSVLEPRGIPPFLTRLVLHHGYYEIFSKY